MIGIYKITNKLNGKVYIGKTTDFEKRKKYHLRRHKAKEYRSYSKLYPAFEKYGVENFEFEFLEDCKIEELNSKEIEYVISYDSFENGYNATKGGNGCIKYWEGRKRDELTKDKIRKTLTGRKMNKEIKDKISKSHKGKHPLKATESRKKRVLCIELNKSFSSILEASLFIKKHSSGINKVLKKQRKTCGGYTWSYLE